MEDQIKIYKVCDVSRINRLTLPAYPTVTSLLVQASTAFGKKMESVYIEADGCRIMTDLALAAFETQLLMLSGEHEAWTPNLIQPTNNTSAFEASGSVLVDSTQNLSTLPLVTVPRIVSVVSKADVSEPCNTVMDTTEMITMQFMDRDDDLLVDAQDEAAPNILLENIESARETSEDTPDTFPIPADRREEHMQNTTLEASEEIVQPLMQNQEENVIGQVCGTTGDIENRSPNLNRKRSSSDGVHLQKSTKKHASTEMTFHDFKINWNRISEHLLNRLRALQEFKTINPNIFPPAEIRMTKTEMKTLTNAVVDQLRMIGTRIRATTMEAVARQILQTFPALDYTDDDGFGAGRGYLDLKQKMVDHNNYLNRFKRAQASNNATSLKKKRNARAGTLTEYWEKSSNQCDKSMQSKLARDEPNLLSNEFLLESQAYIRFKLDEKIDTAKMISQLPVLRRRLLLNFHFEKATGVNIGEFRRYFSSKREKIILYSQTARKTNLHLNGSSSDFDVLQFLCSLVGEDFSELMIQKELGTRIDDIITGSSGPVLVGVDIGNGRTVFYAYANETRLSEGACDVLTAMEDLFTIHFVHNFMYGKAISKFLELLQEYFLKIITLVSSKSTASRVGQRQRVVRKVISALSDFDSTSQTETDV